MYNLFILTAIFYLSQTPIYPLMCLLLFLELWQVACHKELISRKIFFSWFQESQRFMTKEVRVWHRSSHHGTWEAVRNTVRKTRVDTAPEGCAAQGAPDRPAALDFHRLLMSSSGFKSNNWLNYWSEQSACSAWFWTWPHICAWSRMGQCYLWWKLNWGLYTWSCFILAHQRFNFLL